MPQASYMRIVVAIMTIPSSSAMEIIISLGRLERTKTMHLMSIISALIIYIKINNQEGQVMKNIMTLLGAILFMIGATIVLPAFFGYHI